MKQTEIPALAELTCSEHPLPGARTWAGQLCAPGSTTVRVGRGRAQNSE